MGINIFNNEERVLINGICKNEKLASLSKKNVLDALAFSRQIADESDAMIIGLLDGAITKLEAMSDGEWDELKMATPFPVAQTAEDEVSEVPMDAEITE